MSVCGAAWLASLTCSGSRCCLPITAVTASAQARRFWRELPPLVVEQPVRLSGLARPLAGRRRLARMRSSGATSWPMRIAVTVVAVVAVAAIVLGLDAQTMQHKLTAAQQRDAAIAMVVG